MRYSNIQPIRINIIDSSKRNCYYYNHLTNKLQISNEYSISIIYRLNIILLNIIINIIKDIR